MKLGKYKGIKAQKPRVSVSDTDVLRVLKRKQRENAVVTNITERPAMMGDQVILDYDLIPKNKHVPGGQSRDFSLILGSEKFIPGFDEQIVGRCPGDVFEVRVDVPDSYRVAQLAGKPALFRVTLKRIGLCEYQPLDDDFARDFSEYDTLDAWKEEICESILERRKLSSCKKVERQLISAIIRDSVIPIDRDLKQQIADELYEEFLENLAMNGLTLEKWCMRAGCTKRELLKKKEAEAIYAIREQSVLHAIAAKEKLTVSREELVEAIGDFAEEEGISPAEFESLLGEEERMALTDQLYLNKALQFVIEHAVLE